MRLNTPVFVFHEVEDIHTRCDEENLHECVVERDKVEGEQVDVASEEHGDIECLGLE
jgi:hypothetical protein